MKELVFPSVQQRNGILAQLILLWLAMDSKRQIMAPRVPADAGKHRIT
jgi:hypothetical protein